METTPSKTKKSRESSKSASKKDAKQRSGSKGDREMNPALDQVNDLKKKAILKTHGIENVSIYSLRCYVQSGNHSYLNQ